MSRNCHWLLLSSYSIFSELYLFDNRLFFSFFIYEFNISLTVHLPERYFIEYFFFSPYLWIQYYSWTISSGLKFVLKCSPYINRYSKIKKNINNYNFCNRYIAAWKFMSKTQPFYEPRELFSRFTLNLAPNTLITHSAFSIASLSSWPHHLLAWVPVSSTPSYNTPVRPSHSH